MAHKSHDCYCAVCGGILEDYLNIGENTEHSKATREKLIKAGRAERADGSDKSTQEAWRLIHKTDDPRYKVEGSYDPEALQGHDRSWLDKLMCVAYDSDLSTPCQYYFSTERFMDDHEWEVVKARHPDKLDDDENLPLYNLSFHFHDKNPTRKLGFLMHTHCAQVLARAVAGSSDIRLLDPTVLYRLMDKYDHSDKLKLDYGPIQDAQNKYWASSIGEEVGVSQRRLRSLHEYTLILEQYSVTSPLWTSGSPVDKDTARSLVLKHGVGDEQAKGLGVSCTVTDPFGKLPHELIDSVAESLTVSELLVLCQTSMVVREATRGSGIWRRKVYRDMKWAVDVLSEIVGEEQAERTEADPVDWMKVYMLFDHANAHDAWGMKGDYLGLANRKRIWNVCEQIRLLYEARLGTLGAK
jgi:hypothetical protein